MRIEQQELNAIKEKVRVYLSADRYEAAEKLINASIDEYGLHPAVIYLLGTTYHKQSRFLEAIIEYRRAIDIDPDYGEVRLTLAATLCDVGQYEEANEVLDKIEKKSMYCKEMPKFVAERAARRHIKVAEYYENIGLQEQAIVQYRQAAAILPHMIPIKISLAKLYIDICDIEKSIKELNEVIEVNESIVEARVLLALIYRKSGQYEVARSHLLKARQFDPDNRLVNIYLEILDPPKK